MAHDGTLNFGTFEYDSRTGELRRNGIRLKLQAKPAAVLLLLLRNPGKVITTSRFRDEIWASDTFVDFEHSLGIAVWKLRNLLGDQARNPRFIETLPRKGYRFIAPVRETMIDGVPHAKKMLAVLPFDDLGGPAIEDYLADGLTEELITQLGLLNPNRLGVIARASIMRYKATSRTLAEIAFDLRADHLLTGTVRRDGARLRVTAQLIQSATQSPIWTGSYDRLAKDVIEVQIDLADQIATSLKVELLPGQEERVLRTRLHSAEAHEFYLQGRYNWNKRTPHATASAVDYFQKAASADPSYAPAYVGLADCFAVLGFYGDLTPMEAFEKAKKYAGKALELDASLAEANSALAFCLLEYDWDWEAAEHQHLQAIQLNPNCAPAHHWYGITLTQMGSFSEALRSFRRALELDPFDVAIHTQVGRLSYFSHHFERAAVELRYAVQLDNSYLPGLYNSALAMLQCGDEKNAISQMQGVTEALRDHPFPLSGLAYAFGKAGKQAAARRTLERLHDMAGNTRVPPYFIAFAEAGLENTENVLKYLELAFIERFGHLFYLKMEPAFDFLRLNPHFNDLIQRIQPGLRTADRSDH